MTQIEAVVATSASRDGKEGSRHSPAGPSAAPKHLGHASQTPRGGLSRGGGRRRNALPYDTVYRSIDERGTLLAIAAKAGSSRGIETLPEAGKLGSERFR